MNRWTRDEATSCPCLIPALERRAGAFAAPVHCRPGKGRVRVPTRDQLASLCTAGASYECPGYRRWATSLIWDEV